MEPVALNPGNYDGTYKLVGGAVSLDFVNTVSWPGTAREHDWLDRADNVTAWAVAAGALDRRNRAALTRQPKAELHQQLERVRDIRGDLGAVLRPLAFGENPPRAAVETLSALVGRVCALRRISPSSHAWIWVDPASLTEVVAPVIWNAAHVLTSVDHARISHCRSCNWLFYDTTRNRSRQWCDMKDCGSRDKALRYYHRKRSPDR